MKSLTKPFDITLVPRFLFFFPLFFLSLLGFLRNCPDLFLCCKPRNLGATLINLVPLFCLSRDSNPCCWNSCTCWEINHKFVNPIFQFEYQMFDPFQNSELPSLNTQSCIRRPLCSTFRFENLIISPKKRSFFCFRGQKFEK